MSAENAFAREFLGYGTWRAPIWLVGMQEGGGTNDLEQRLHVWDQRGRHELEDLADYHREIGVTRHFDGRKLQLTWAKLIHLLFGLHGKHATPEDVRDYQATKLGRSDGETVLLELLPLSSSSKEIAEHPRLTSASSVATRYSPQSNTRMRAALPTPTSSTSDARSLPASPGTAPPARPAGSAH